MPTKANIPFTGRLPQVHEALLELHLLADHCLADLTVPSWEVTRIRRATERACFAVEVAASGNRRRFHLARAKEAVAFTMAFFRHLCLHDRIDVGVFDEVQRRVIQIFAGLDRLSEIGDGDWMSAELPPLDPPASDQSSPPGLPVLRRAVARIAEVARNLAKTASSRRSSETGGKRKMPVAA